MLLWLLLLSSLMHKAFLIFYSTVCGILVLIPNSDCTIFAFFFLLWRNYTYLYTMMRWVFYRMVHSRESFSFSLTLSISHSIHSRIYAYTLWYCNTSKKQWQLSAPPLNHMMSCIHIFYNYYFFLLLLLLLLLLLCSPRHIHIYLCILHFPFYFIIMYDHLVSLSYKYKYIFYICFLLFYSYY